MAVAIIDINACPYVHDHTAAPWGYLARQDWMRKMSRTHRQEKCSGCGRFVIWVPRRPTPQEKDL